MQRLRQQLARRLLADVIAPADVSGARREEHAKAQVRVAQLRVGFGPEAPQAALRLSFAYGKQLGAGGDVVGQGLPVAADGVGRADLLEPLAWTSNIRVGVSDRNRRYGKLEGRALKHSDKRGMSISKAAMQ